MGLSPIIANITIANKNHSKVAERVKKDTGAKQSVSEPQEDHPYNGYIKINMPKNIKTFLSILTY